MFSEKEKLILHRINELIDSIDKKLEIVIEIQDIMSIEDQELIKEKLQILNKKLC